MEEDTEYKKLPIDERCVHKLWKARVSGYEDAAKLFRQIDEEKSPEWSKYLGLIKKFVVDSNAMAQEKGLEAALLYIENAGCAGKTVGDVMPGIVLKCMAAPKTKTKELAVQVTLMYIEIEKHEAVLEELLKGMDQKNPKIVSACVAATTMALKEFGSKVISVKPLIKKLAPLMSDRDKTVREEGKTLAVEIYRWIGAAMKSQISSLPQITQTELEGEFDKLKGEKAEPLRYLKSQQEKQAAKAAAAVESGDPEGDDEEAAGGEEIDPMDLVDPVDILSKLPKDFYEKIEAKKWQERKEALEALEKLLEAPKLENGDYGALVSTVKKVVAKDTNVVLVALAGKCMGSLAKGLAKRFSPYSLACVSTILEKFKEKKINVVTSLRDAIDAIYPSTNLEALQDSLVEALANKNPSIKFETASFLARAFTRTQPAAINKKIIKALVTSLTKTLNESDPAVRDASAEALGTLLKLMGDKVVGGFLVDIDPLKMAKIKECQDKAVIQIKIAGVKKERPATAPAKAEPAPVKKAMSAPKPVARPATASGVKKVVKKVPASAPLSKSASTAKVLPSEREMTPEEVTEQAEEILPPEILTGLADANWKNRLAAVESLLALVNDLDPKTPNISQVLIRTISGRKPGLKEINFQVLKIKLEIIKAITERFPFTQTTAEFVINEITEKLADSKNSAVAASVLSSISEATKLDIVVIKVVSFAFEQKSPKVQSEALLWVSTAIKEFGFQIQPKFLIDDVRKGVQSTNPTVRGAAITLIGTMTLYMGNTLMMFFDSEKPALKTQIQTEMDKNMGQKPPAPTRGVKKSASADKLDDDADSEPAEAEPINMADLLPRVDISPQITEALLAEISDKNWKTRNEGLIKLQNIISEAKLIKPSLGDLVTSLGPRLTDSNAKICQTSITICEQLATSMGPACKAYCRVLFPHFLRCLSDSKAIIRQNSLSCINTWGDQAGFKEFFEGEMLAEAFKTGSPALKTELWGWVAEKLPNIPVKQVSKDELMSLVPHLYANICDRSVDVRKNANEAVLGIMIHLGFENMVRALDKEKPASKKDIQAALDKARPNLPIKPLPKNKQQAPVIEEPKKVVRGGGGSSSKLADPKKIEKPNGATSRGKKEEDVDTSPLLAVNNYKNQRCIDEQKLKVLKWTFTTPREEFTELLRDQMSSANVNKGLIANMFHDDFRYHLKAIESLSEDLPLNTKALICNLDLILKWISLRFYDTNPSVLLKGLEYLNFVFQKLVENEYFMADNEGSAFIPHLLTKIGDPKDAVRNGVRSLLRQIILVYPYTKTFVYIMDGLKTKNARQRTECLDELGFLIESHGLQVCQPSPQVALKEMARHISDRDNSVRNAALNAVVQAYFLAGEKIYKLIGNLTEKDLSMLDERIKRSKVKPKKPVEATKSPVVVKTSNIEIEDAEEETSPIPPAESDSPVSSTQSQSMSEDHTHGSGDELKIRTLNRQQTFDQPAPVQIQIIKPSGPFGLDPEEIANIEKDWVRVDDMNNDFTPSPDISHIFEPIKVLPTKEGFYYPQDKFEQLLARSRSQYKSPSGGGRYNTYNNNLSPTANFHRPGSANNSPNPLLDVRMLDPNLLRNINAIGSTDSLIARAAMNEISDIIESPERQAVLRDYEEIVIQNILTQFKNLSTQPIQESLILYQPLLSITFSFFNTKTLGKNLGIVCLKNIVSVLLNLMADQKLAVGDDGQYTRVMNGICLKILDRANFTNLNCALIRLLKETCQGAALPKFTDLLMKCIWRNVKNMPERANELDYDPVLSEVNEFMIALPTLWWANRPSDTPNRTVKTIIHNIVKIKGNSILENLNKISVHSELHTYVLKTLKSLGAVPSVSPQRSSSNKDSHQNRRTQVQEALHQIFKTIAKKDTSLEGLQRLAEFKAKNPEIDLAPYMRNTSASFQKFVEDGLARFDKQKKQMNGVHNTGNNFELT
ncbi:msps family protein [Megaselia abdita]